MHQMHEKLGEFGLNTRKLGCPGAGKEPAAEAMIALVPDPVHTHLALLFDRYIDVIQQALQDSTSENAPGWIYASQWLPWDPVPYQASQDPIARTNIHAFDADRECAPGFLIFRRNRFQSSASGKVSGFRSWWENPPRAVFSTRISSSTPCAAGARWNREMRISPAGRCASSAPPSRLLSPRSIVFYWRRSVARRCRSQRLLRPRTGHQRFRFDKSQDHPRFGKLSWTARANFISMNESAETIRQMLLNYLSDQERIPADKVAFVSEDETPFGNLLSSTCTVRPSRRRPKAPVPCSFHYPREISQLRNAYEKNSIFSRQSATQNPGTQNSTDLSSASKTATKEEDSVPSFSDTQNPISEESVLSAITRAMNRQHVRVAVINGTNVLDVIFVARYFSRNLPDVRVILLNADMLFLRSPDVSDFRGMLMADTYPLIPDNVQWSGRFLHVPAAKAERDHPVLSAPIFPIESSPRTRTSASTTQSACSKWSLSRSEPDGMAPTRNGSRDYLWLPEYTDPFRGGNHPPLWLNSIGRGDFWPVALARPLSPRRPGEQAVPRKYIASPCSGGQHP